MALPALQRCKGEGQSQANAAITRMGTPIPMPMPIPILSPFERPLESSESAGAVLVCDDPREGDVLVLFDNGGELPVVLPVVLDPVELVEALVLVTPVVSNRVKEVSGMVVCTGITHQNAL